jgi:hypothetical protein
MKLAKQYKSAVSGQKIQLTVNIGNLNDITSLKQ